MIVVLSGEGPTDLGRCTNAQQTCQIPEFEYGPMTLLADLVITDKVGYSILDTTPHCYHYLSERRLGELEHARKQDHRKIVLPGKKSNPETAYFHINALVLGEEAQRIGVAENDHAVIAILFRDTDGTRSTAKGLWELKWASMASGFERSGLGIRGVPMLPKPKSEAWLLCAIKDQPYQHCQRLEELSGNDNAPVSAKQQLEEALGATPSRVNLVAWIQQHSFDWKTASAIEAVPGTIDRDRHMPSLHRFVERLLQALDSILHPAMEVTAS